MPALRIEEYQNLGEAIERGRHDVAYFAEEFLGMPLHAGQRFFYKNARGKVNVLVPANRWGKSITVAIKHIHRNFYKIGLGQGNAEAHARAAYMTANLAPHSDATKPVFDAMKSIMTSSFAIPQADGSVKSNDCKISWLLDEAHIRNSVPYVIPFTNRTQTIFRSTGEDKGDSIQGKNFGYISYDEGGRSNHLEYELNANIIPRLADLNGELDIVSTPDMKSASILFHYELFEKGNNHEYGYYSQEGSITDNVFLLRNNPTYVEDETRRLAGDPIADQVLHGKFVFAGDNIFPTPDILEAKDPELTAGVPYEAAHHYIVGVDTAMGEDEMVFTVLREPMKDCLSHNYCVQEKYALVRQISCKGNSKSPQIHQADFESLVRSYMRTNNLKVILETWNGESARFYQDLPYDLQMVTKCFGSWQPPGITAKMVGRNPRNVKKAEIILALRKLLATGSLGIPNEPTLVKQLSIYREDDTRLPTDRVISLSLAAWMATDGKPKITEIEYAEVEW